MANGEINRRRNALFVALAIEVRVRNTDALVIDLFPDGQRREGSKPVTVTRPDRVNHQQLGRRHQLECWVGHVLNVPAQPLHSLSRGQLCVGHDRLHALVRNPFAGEQSLREVCRPLLLVSVSLE
ncbi:hypothetical protein D3C86_1369210 [compost metagenome]